MNGFPDRPEITLKALLEEGFCLLALLQGGARPLDSPSFHARLATLAAAFEQRALGLGKPGEAVREVKYAFCALADEVLLGTEGPLREGWERAPLQLSCFGEHLAGEGFFRHLDRLRQDPGVWAETLEVYHTCLLLGFQGKYCQETPERLQALTDRLGQELARVRPLSPSLAPYALPPARSTPSGRRLLPPWAFVTLAGGLTLALYLALALTLRAKTRALNPQGVAWNPPPASSW